MKQLILITLIGVSLSCNSNQESRNSSAANGNAVPVRTVEAVTPNQNSNIQTPSDPGIALFRSSVGKTADDIHLWENKEITARLEKLLGPDYADMKKYWQTQSPIEAEQNVLSLTGCEAHNCGDNQYLMYIDTANNNINVFHVKSGKMKEYKEKGVIVLPSRLAKDFENMTENANITK